MVVEKDEVLERWNEHLGLLLNVRSERDTVVSTMGFAGTGGRRESAAMKKIKMGKAPGADGI